MVMGEKIKPTAGRGRQALQDEAVDEGVAGRRSSRGVAPVPPAGIEPDDATRDVVEPPD